MECAYTTRLDSVRVRPLRGRAPSHPGRLYRAKNSSPTRNSSRICCKDGFATVTAQPHPSTRRHDSGRFARESRLLARLDKDLRVFHWSVVQNSVAYIQ